MMNPGVFDETGKTIRTFISAIKDPVVLSLCAMNLVLLLLFFYVIRTATEVRRTEMDRIFAAQSEVQKLLFNCVPARGGEFKLQSDKSHPVELTPLPQPRPKEANDNPAALSLPPL